MVERLQVPTVADMHTLGRELANRLRPGDLVVLAGPLGAGKTVLAQGIGAGLRVVGAVTSPTFVIARVHPPDRAAGGELTMVHVDAYRLGGGADPRAEIDDLDLDASVDASVTVVEWGEGVVEQLADAHLLVRIDRPAGGGDATERDEPRQVELIGRGGNWTVRLADLAMPVGCTRVGASA